MRWLVPFALLLSSLAASAGTSQALRDLLVKMDQLARLGKPLDAKDLPALLGLKFDTECLEHLRSANNQCWRELSAPTLGWRGVYGRYDALGTVVSVTRRLNQAPCVRAADLATALPTPSRMQPQLAGIGHIGVDGLEVPVPHFESMPTWRYAAPRAGRETMLVLKEAQGCVREIALNVDLPLPIEGSPPRPR
ncbi:hypothetical protein [Roseateles sp. LYH14W]|uniref:Uncharacterized protein n=1 Tax=Pelomonas parva TaxID=3299032 RepID=A0ABW7F8R1_9BURK